MYSVTIPFHLVDVQALADVEGQFGVAGGAAHQSHAVSLVEPTTNLALRAHNHTRLDFVNERLQKLKPLKM